MLCKIVIAREFCGSRTSDLRLETKLCCLVAVISLTGVFIILTGSCSV